MKSGTAEHLQKVKAEGGEGQESSPQATRLTAGAGTLLAWSFSPSFPSSWFSLKQLKPWGFPLLSTELPPGWPDAETERVMERVTPVSGSSMGDGLQVGSQELKAVQLGWSLEGKELPAWEGAVANPAEVGSPIGLDPECYGKLLERMNRE